MWERWAVVRESGGIGGALAQWKEGQCAVLEACDGSLRAGEHWGRYGKKTSWLGQLLCRCWSKHLNTLSFCENILPVLLRACLLFHVTLFNPNTRDSKQMSLTPVAKLFFKAGKTTEISERKKIPFVWQVILQFFKESHQVDRTHLRSRNEANSWDLKWNCGEKLCLNTDYRWGFLNPLIGHRKK